MAKITFTMVKHEDQPKHSTRYNFEDFEGAAPDSSLENGKFKPSFYIPKPFAEKPKRIRVTIEEL